MMTYVLLPFKWLLIAFFCVLRALNLLEPSDSGVIPVRDYFPIVSWSKLARVVGLYLVVGLIVSGATDQLEMIVALLTYIGGETAYRARQYIDVMKGSAQVDNPDQEDEQ